MLSKMLSILLIVIFTLLVFYSNIDFVVAMCGCVVPDDGQCKSGVSCAVGSGGDRSCIIIKNGKDPECSACGGRTPCAYVSSDYSEKKANCEDDYVICEGQKCPDEAGEEGSICEYIDDCCDGWFCWVGYCRAKTGRWDPDDASGEKHCVICDWDKQTQLKRIVDTTERCWDRKDYECDGPDTWLSCSIIDETCEEACGADPECDEVAAGTGNCDANCKYISSTTTTTIPGPVCDSCLSSDQDVCCCIQFDPLKMYFRPDSCNEGDEKRRPFHCEQVLSTRCHYYCVNNGYEYGIYSEDGDSCCCSNGDNPPPPVDQCGYYCESGETPVCCCWDTETGPHLWMENECTQPRYYKADPLYCPSFGPTCSKYCLDHGYADGTIKGDACCCGSTTSTTTSTSTTTTAVSGEPDLIITDISVSGNEILYRIENRGDGSTEYYSYSHLYVDGSYEAPDYVDTLAAGAFRGESFSDYTCTGAGRTIEVCVDGTNRIIESNETNNCRTEILDCPSTGCPDSCDWCSPTCHPSSCDDTACDCWYLECDPGSDGYGSYCYKGDCVNSECTTRFTCCQVGDTCQCDNECPPGVECYGEGGTSPEEKELCVHSTTNCWCGGPPTTTSTTTETTSTSTTTTTAPPTCNLRIIDADPPDRTPSGSEAKAEVRVENWGTSNCYAIVKCEYQDPSGVSYTDSASECKRINSGNSDIFEPKKTVTEIGTWNVVSCSAYSSLLDDCSDIADPPESEWLNVGTFEVYSGPTTTSTTTTETTSTTTSTTTTIPTEGILLECDYYQLHEGESNACNITLCNSGLWIVYDDKGNPPIIEDISASPTQKSFTAEEEGEITSIAVCFDPTDVKEFTTQVLRGFKLICPDDCYDDQDCMCQVTGCENGMFTLSNSEGNPLDSTVLEFFTDTEFNYTFKANDTGKVLAMATCEAPEELKGVRTKTINILEAVTTTSTTTTAVEKDFEMSFDKCSERKEECEIYIDINTIDEDVVILIWLFEEYDGIIYYSGEEKIDEDDEEIKIDIDLEEDCPDDTDLVFLALAYKESDDDYENPLDRIKEDTFTCG